MIKEEYDYEDIKDYLSANIDLLIIGMPNEEERSHYFKDSFFNSDKEILIIQRINEGDFKYEYYKNSTLKDRNEGDLCVFAPRLLKGLKIEEKSVLLDMASLDNVLIMFFTKQLLTQVMPKLFFASYIRPDSYYSQEIEDHILLSDRISAVKAVPGFAKRVSDNQVLCAFIGFEGIRLKNVLEATNNISRFIPIVAFPSGNLNWYNLTIWNCMDTLQSACTDPITCKCYSESVFDAVEFLEDSILPEDKAILAPLGTRTHSMACAIFASRHKNTEIIYDFVEECNRRTTGVSKITIYHLSAFMDN